MKGKWRNVAVFSMLAIVLAAGCGGGGGGTGGGSAPSHNANLAGLVLSQGTLSPVFSAGTTTYTVALPDPTPSMTLTPTAEAVNASITVNGSAVASAATSGTIALVEGANIITIVVTAEDTTTVKTYTITVTAPPTPALRYLFEGSTANIGGLAGYALTTSGTVTYASGKSGQAIAFGAGGSATVTGMRTVLGASGPATVSFWMNESAELAGEAFWSVNNRSVAPYGGVQLGQNGASISVCASSTSNAALGGSCLTFASPTTNAWHHWIIRYNGTGTGSGQGGAVQIYVDDFLALTIANDVNNNPVFNSTGMSDTLVLGGSTVKMDDLRIYNRIFTQAEQCTMIAGGAWTGTACTLP